MSKKIKNLVIKVIKTMAETALALIGTSTFITDVNWLVVFSAVLLSGVVTILFNLTQLKTEE